MPWSLDGAGAAKGSPLNTTIYRRDVYARVPWGSAAGPNYGSEQTAYAWDNVSIPAGATMAHITASCSARAGNNAAGGWHLYVWDGGWTKIDYQRCHNVGDQYNVFNTGLSAFWPVVNATGAVNVHVNVSVDSGGVSWQMHNGAITITWFGPS